MVLNWIVQPVLGAVIGSVTNYIAIKMMFRPYTEKYIFGKKLPFTPGIIPARRKDIARAIGQMVEDNLIGRDEIGQALLEDKMVKRVRQEIMDYHVNIPVDVEGKKSPGDIAAELFCKLDIKEVVAREATAYIREKIEGNFFGKFYSGQILTAIPGNSRSNLACHCSAETEASFEVFAGDYLCIAGAGIRPRGRA